MKKLRYCVILLCIILFPLKANALTGSIKINCTPSSVSAGESISCIITGSSNGTVTSVEIPISVSNNLTIQKFDINSNFFEGSDFNNNKIESYSKDSNGITGDFTVGTITLKVNSSATAGSETVKLSSVIFDDENSERNNVSDFSTNITITAANSESTLSSLEVSGGEITTVGGFKPEVKSYIVEINNDATTFSLTATATNSGDVITYYNESVSDSNKIDNKNIEFKPATGKNSMSIIIKVGTTEYTLIIQKDTSTTTSVNTLSSLTVGGVKVSLSSCTKTADDSMSCSVTIPASSNGYKVEATVSDSENFKIDESDGNGTGDYNGGPSNFIIKVVPKNESSGYSSLTYYVTVNRSGTTSTGSDKDVTSNPQTSGVTSVIVAIILIGSLAASFILYKKNIKWYQQ